MDLNGTSFSNGSHSCAVGVQIRKVNCVKMNVGPVISKRYADLQHLKHLVSAAYMQWQCNIHSILGYCTCIQYISIYVRLKSLHLKTKTKPSIHMSK